MTRLDANSLPYIQQMVPMPLCYLFTLLCFAAQFTNGFSVALPELCCTVFFDLCVVKSVMCCVVVQYFFDFYAAKRVMYELEF